MSKSILFIACFAFLCVVFDSVPAAEYSITPSLSGSLAEDGDLVTGERSFQFGLSGQTTILD